MGAGPEARGANVIPPSLPMVGRMPAPPLVKHSLRTQRCLPKGMTCRAPEPSPALAELARASGVATEYWDWQGNHVIVSAPTISAVLQALGVDTSDDAAVARSLAVVADRAWRRTLPPIVVCRQGSARWVPVHLPDGDDGPGVGDPRGWNTPRGSSGRPLRRAPDHRRPADRGRRPSRCRATCRWAGTRSTRGSVKTPSRPRWSSHPPPWSCRPRCSSEGLGPAEPDVLRPVPAVVGSWGPRRSRRHDGLGGGRPERGLRPGEPPARGRAGGPDGAFALSAHVPAVRQPDLHPGRGHPGDGLPVLGGAAAAGVARG